MSSEYFENLVCFVGQDLTTKLQTLEIPSLWRNAWH